MTHDIICTITKAEQDELAARFKQYQDSGDSTTLDEYKSELGIKYDFDPKKVSFTSDGKARHVF